MRRHEPGASAPDPNHAVFPRQVCLDSQKSDHVVQPGHGLPPAPYGREQSRGADALLKAPIQAKPDRNVELRSRSQEREDDPFDLPPEE